jgi:hypothetical protein
LQARHRLYVAERLTFGFRFLQPLRECRRGAKCGDRLHQAADFGLQRTQSLIVVFCSPVHGRRARLRDDSSRLAHNRAHAVGGWGGP